MGVGIWVDGINNGRFDPRDPGLTRGMTVFETLHVSASAVCG